MSINMKIVLEIDAKGDVYGLYTDEIDLFNIGRITNVKKASNIEFNEKEQLWEVLSLKEEILYRDANRQKAIDWEIINFSSGGKYFKDIRIVN